MLDFVLEVIVESRLIVFTVSDALSVSLEPAWTSNPSFTAVDHLRDPGHLDEGNVISQRLASSMTG